MQPTKSFIGSQSTGLELDITPYLLQEDAYPNLSNFYLWRSRGKKKLGHKLLGKLQRNFTDLNIGNTSASVWTFNLFTVASINDGSQQRVKPGSVVITIGGTIVFTDQGNGTLTSVTPGNSGTINYATASISLTHTAGAGVATTATFSYFPGLPVMGLPTRELEAINAEALFAFDTKYAYQYSNTFSRFEEVPSTLMTATWSGTNSQLFFTQNILGALFVTNQTDIPGNTNAGIQGYTITGITQAASAVVTIGAHILQVGDYVYFDQVAGMTQINGLTGQITGIGANTITVNINSTAFSAYSSGGVLISQNRIINTSKDNIRWYGDTIAGATWSNFIPPVNATSFLVGAGMIFYYRNHVICLDTQEQANLASNPIRYHQRARWAQFGTPYYASNPIPTNQTSQATAWRDDIPGRGGALDAPTSERITGAAFLKDNLIVAFERSTWRLRYTSNELQPFEWVRINEEFGASGIFSFVRFDAGPIAIGSRGIIQCNGSSTYRIDLKIPDVAFSFENENSGPQRIYGIRDFDEQVVYFAFPNNQEQGIFPNRVLLYNYQNQSYAFLKDSFTCFGNWQSFSDLQWKDVNVPWGSANFQWNSQKNQALYPKIVGGNQQGYVLVVQDISAINEVSLRIESITPGSPAVFTSTDHNLETGMYVKPQNIVGNGSTLNGITYMVYKLSSSTFNLYQISDPNDPLAQFNVQVSLSAGTYLGGGELQIVDNFVVDSKQFNPIVTEGSSIDLVQMDFYTDVTSAGKFLVNLYVNSNSSDVANPPLSNNTESNVLETFLNQYDMPAQERVWHSTFDTVTGNFVQYQLTLSPYQIYHDEISGSPVVIYGVIVYTQPASERLT